MDEETQKNSVTQADQKLSEDRDSIPVEKVVEQNVESIDKLTDDSESKSSEINTIIDYETDNLESTALQDAALTTAEQEKDEPEKKAESETPQSSTDDGNDAEKFQKEERSETEDTDYDRGGVDTEDEVTEEVAQSDSRETDEGETVKGSPEEKEATKQSDEEQEFTENVENCDPAGQAQIEPEASGSEEKADDIAAGNAFESPAGKPSVVKVAVAVVLIAAAFGGFFLFDGKPKVTASSQKTLNTSQDRKILPDRPKRTRVRKPVASETGSIYDAKIEEITALRDRLLRKQKEIMHLKNQYQEGIEELEKEISDELQKKDITTFAQALQDSAIVFTLKTIQRRQAYIQELQRPSSWIQQACEELLYLKRRTMMDIEVAEIADGIDLNTNVALINAAVQKYKPTADRLALDMRNAQLEPLESIWERIQNKTQQYASVRVHSKNQIISEQICTGNFSRLSELSEISAQTASCISAMRGSDLFLNSLAEISPAAARQLSQWKGAWICLNGVRALSPRTAHYLFQWDGNWISLNGLTEFPAEIGEKLLQWHGHQLELMGLQYHEDFPSGIALEYLARWEQAGGKLFIPEALRKKLDEINA